MHTDPPVAFDLTNPAALDFSELMRQCLNEAGHERGVAGVQEKVSGGMISLPVRGKRANKAYILKLNPRDRPLLVENEALFLEMAKDCGIASAEAQVVHDAEGRSGLLVVRFDRVTDGNSRHLRPVHQEDACQLLERYPADRYRITCQEVVQALREFATAPIVQVLRFIELQAFNYLIGNGDFHAKNVSVLQSRTTELVKLSPAYDVHFTQAYRGLDQRMPMLMDGKDDRLRSRDFVDFATRNGVREAAMRASLERLVTRARPWLDHLDRVPWKTKDRDRVARSMERRLKDLSN